MKSIENIVQLRMEVQRLHIQKNEQHALILNDIQELKDSVKPARLIGSTIADMLSKHGKDRDLVIKGAGFGASLLTKNWLLKNANPTVKKVVSFFLENLTTNVVADKEDTLFDKINKFLVAVKITKEELVREGKSILNREEGPSPYHNPPQP
jgi:hypothetical protein